MRSGRQDLIGNEILRERALCLVESGEVSWSVLAIRCGRSKGGSSPTRGDTSWIQRRLGLRVPQKPGGKGKGYKPKIQSHVSYEVAVTIANALGLDPVDIGL